MTSTFYSFVVLATFTFVLVHSFVPVKKIYRLKMVSSSSSPTTSTYSSNTNNNVISNKKLFLATTNTPTEEQEGLIDLLYDSECPICQMEVDFLKKRDINHRIRFTDLSSPDYNPADHGNVKFEDGMRKIRAVLPDQTVVTGVEVFRQTYKSIGLGWVFAATSIPVIGQAADFLYDVWAENRLRLTGRGDMADVLKQRATELREKEPVECDENGCALDL
jgi:predicted DCC family thiol-disulfide oxidoreductase YuxK